MLIYSSGYSGYEMAIDQLHVHVWLLSTVLLECPDDP